MAKSKARDPVDPEVAQLVRVGEGDDAGRVPDARLADPVLHVEGILERRALARAGPVTRPDDEDLACTLPHPGDRCLERGRSVGGVGRRAHRVGLAVGAEPGRGPEVEAGAGRVDQVVVVGHPARTGPGRAGSVWAMSTTSRVRDPSPSGRTAVASAWWDPVPVRR